MSLLQLLFPPTSEPVRVPDFERIRETVRIGPTAAFDWGFELPEMDMARIAALPEPEWARPQNDGAAAQAYADAEARVSTAMWPQRLPADTKKTTAATVRRARDVRELLDLLAEGILAAAELPGGIGALTGLFAPAGEVIL